MNCNPCICQAETSVHSKDKLFSAYFFSGNKCLLVLGVARNSAFIYAEGYTWGSLWNDLLTRVMDHYTASIVDAYRQNLNRREAVVGAPYPSSR